MNVLLAEFGSPEALIAAVHAARRRNLEVVDAFTPFPVKELAPLLPEIDRGQRLVMLAGGLLIGGLCYLLEWWTATIAYPFNSGGRPLHSWPVFFLFPFEFGVLAAGVVGLVLLLFKTGLPRPHHPIFECDLYARSNVDAFLLAVKAPAGAQDLEAARAFLVAQGAAATRGVEL